MTKKDVITIGTISTAIVVVLLGLFIYFDVKRINTEKIELKKDIPEEISIEYKKFNFTILNEAGKEVFNETVYDGLTLDELSDKLNKSLNSTLSNTGSVFATKSLELGIDPYLTVAIALYETGCKWNCSTLVKQCNNVGGVKGSPSCNGGSYKYYPSLKEGIEKYITNLYNNYYALGLTTPELMEKKYTGGSTTWAIKVNNYITSIKAS